MATTAPKNPMRPNWGKATKGKVSLLGVRAAVTTEERLRRIIGDGFAVEEEGLNGGTRLEEDLEFDSLDFVELSMRIEECFGFEFRDDEDFGRLRTVGD